MTRDEIIDKIRKVQALATGGVGGEKDAASKALAVLMKKYNITDDDLVDEKEEVFFMKIKGHDCKDIFAQVCAVHCGCKRFQYFGPDSQTNNARVLRENCRLYEDRWHRGDNMAIVCTIAQFLEIEYAYQLFQASYDKQHESFLYAFFLKNDLLAEGNSDDKSTAEELEMALKAAMMAGSIEKVNVHKRLGSGYTLPAD